MNRLSDPASADRVSGAVPSPCPDSCLAADRAEAGRLFAFRQLPPAWEPSADFMRYGRMLRPFPTRKLAEAIYWVEADTATVSHIVRNLLIEPPQTAAPWCEALYHLLDVLDSVADRALARRAQVEQMIDTADADATRAAVALRALLEMSPRSENEPEIEAPPPFVDEPAPFREPVPCPQCGGFGGSVSDGNCDMCQGTGIDPEDPASPL